MKATSSSVLSIILEALVVWRLKQLADYGDVQRGERLALHWFSE